MLSGNGNETSNVHNWQAIVEAMIAAPWIGQKPCLDALLKVAAVVREARENSDDGQTKAACAVKIAPFDEEDAGLAVATLNTILAAAEMKGPVQLFEKICTPISKEAIEMRQSYVHYIHDKERFQHFRFFFLRKNFNY